jgi:hypothetical protein
VLRGFYIQPDKRTGQERVRTFQGVVNGVFKFPIFCASCDGGEINQNEEQFKNQFYIPLLKALEEGSRDVITPVVVTHHYLASVALQMLALYDWQLDNRHANYFRQLRRYTKYPTEANGKDLDRVCSMCIAHAPDNFTFTNLHPLDRSLTLHPYRWRGRGEEDCLLYARLGRLFFLCFFGRSSSIFGTKYEGLHRLSSSGQMSVFRDRAFEPVPSQRLPLRERMPDEVPRIAQDLDPSGKYSVAEGSQWYAILYRVADSMTFTSFRERDVAVKELLPRLRRLNLRSTLPPGSVGDASGDVDGFFTLPPGDTMISYVVLDQPWCFSFVWCCQGRNHRYVLLSMVDLPAENRYAFALVWDGRTLHPPSQADSFFWAMVPDEPRRLITKACSTCWS